jgi:hypothetical protein
MARKGRFTYQYNPDEGTPLPRPFLLDGMEKGAKSVDLKPFKPEKMEENPDKYLSREPGDLYSIKWFKEFAKIEKGSRIGYGQVTLTKLSKGLAQSLLGSGATGGYYLRQQTGVRHNPLGGDPIPVYNYVRVSKNFLDVWENGNPKWATDPKAALAFAKQLYTYGLTKDYKSLKKWMIATAMRIRDDQRYNYLIWRNQMVESWKAYRDKWVAVNG